MKGTVESYRGKFWYLMMIKYGVKWVYPLASKEFFLQKNEELIIILSYLPWGGGGGR